MKRDAHFLTYLELMNAPTKQQVASRTLRRWLITTAVLASVGIAVLYGNIAWSKALHDAAYARQVTP